MTFYGGRFQPGAALVKFLPRPIDKPAAAV